MRGMRLVLGLGKGKAGLAASYTVTITGLTSGEARPGDHASIGFTTDPVGGTITQKWGSTLGGSEYGTGSAPTDYTAGDGGTLYLEVTRDGEVVRASAPIRDAAPVISGAPTISGTEVVGQTLTATAASVTGTSTRTWQWERSGTPISGATASTYTLQAADGGETLTIVQTETNSGGTDSAESTATGTIAVIATITIVSVSAQESSGDVPVSYTIDIDDSTVEAVIFDAAQADPAAADFNGGGAPTYVDQGTVSLTTSGSPINLTITGTFNGSVKLALLPTGGGDGDVVVSSAFTLDTTAPTLSSVSTTAGDTTGDLDWSTDTGSGTAYWILTTSATPPSNAAIIAGTGAVGSNFGSAAVSGTGAQTAITATSLTNSTTYYFHIFHRDAVSNDSAVSTASVVPAAAVSTITPSLLDSAKSATGTAASKTVSIDMTGHSGTDPVYIGLPIFLLDPADTNPTVTLDGNACSKVVLRPAINGSNARMATSIYKVTGQSFTGTVDLTVSVSSGVIFAIGAAVYSVPGAASDATAGVDCSANLIDVSQNVANGDGVIAVFGAEDGSISAITGVTSDYAADLNANEFIKIGSAGNVSAATPRTISATIGNNNAGGVSVVISP